MIHNDNDYANKCFVAFLFELCRFPSYKSLYYLMFFWYLVLHFTSICHMYSSDVFVVYNEPQNILRNRVSRFTNENLSWLIYKLFLIS